MHNVATDHAVSIEVSTLKGLRGSAAWVELVLTMAVAFGGRAHWGQQNHPTPTQVETSYGQGLTTWREILGTMSAGNNVFSSSFTTSRGLEPQGQRMRRRGRHRTRTVRVDARPYVAPSPLDLSVAGT